MKKALVILAVFGLSASLGAQSLVDLARSEKARREALKGRPAVLVRNRDLLAVKKTPAVEVLDTAGEETGEAAPPAAGGRTIPPGAQIVPQVEADGPALVGDQAIGRPDASAKVLEAQLRAAEERVDLLATKMAALRQQYDAQNAMMPGSAIQQQIAETNETLVRAQAQLARIKEQLDKKRAGTSQGPVEIEH
ncbi:MAG: hypothetical protein ABFD52_00825 [Acidobacteriota bacterium]